MHIHKPKAPHSVREFASEIGVIVVGILIALAGEQVVEWVHWRAVTAETREAVDRELAGNLGVVQTRIDQAPCIRRRLAELDQAFRWQAEGAPIETTGPIGQPQFPHIRSAVWETAVAAQAAAHMPLSLRLRYANLYDALYWFRDKAREESEAWSHLSQFDDRAVMTEADWSALHQWKARAQALAVKVDPNILPYPQGSRLARPIMDEAADLGVKPEAYRFKPGAGATRDRFCEPMFGS